MNAAYKWGACLMALWLVCITGVPVQADPLSGEFLKFGLAPQDGTAQVPSVINPTVLVNWPYFGHDEESSAYRDPNSAVPRYVVRPGGQFMADDFQDKLISPVVHVRWWGSYLNNAHRVPEAVLPTKFLIAWERDVPASTGGLPFSHPAPFDRALGDQSEIVTLGPLAPGSGTYTEQPWKAAPGPALDDIFVYNAELHCPFPQQADEIYWLKIVALFDSPADPTGQPPPVIWGWHNRDYTKPAAGFPSVGPAAEFQGTVTDGVGNAPVFHYIDDAVSGFFAMQTTSDPCVNDITQTGYQPENYGPTDGPTIIVQFSKDLAFELYTIPEPSSLVLAGCGVAVLVGYGLRRRQR